MNGMIWERKMLYDDDGGSTCMSDPLDLIDLIFNCDRMRWYYYVPLHFEDGWLMMTIHVPCSIIFPWWLQYRSTNGVILWGVWRRRRWQRRRCPPPPLWSMKVIWISTLWTYIISWTSRFNALVNRLSSLGTDGFLYINIRNRWIVGGSYHHRWHAGDVAVSDQNRFSCSVV